MTDFENIPDPITADYALWTPDTIVELHNVPWNNDYRDIVDWKTASARRKWFDDRPVTSITRIEGMSYARITEPIRLEIPFTTAYRYNYIRVINGPQVPTATPATEYFYFITAIAQPSPGVTMLTVQLDVWTSFGIEATFGKSYVERGHIGIANENNFSNFGRDFLTVPEGMDVGNEYQVVHHVSEDIMHKVDREHDDFTTHVLIASTVDFESDAGTYDKPKLNTAKGSNVQGLPSGASFYAITLQQLPGFMDFFKNKPWMTQGIISLTVVPELYRYGAKLEPIAIAGLKSALNKVTIDDGRGRMFNMLNNWRDNNNLKNQIPAKYRHLRKFFTYPYMALELTSFTGAPVVLKPELWNDPNAWVSEKVALTPPNQRIVHWPVKYNAGRGSTIVDRNFNTVFDDNGEYLDVNITTANLPQLALVNNGYMAFMASNANSIASQWNQADWSQQKALQGNAVSYDQANNSIQTAANNATTGRNAAIYQNAQANDYAWQNVGLNAAGSILGSAGKGPGAFAGAVGNAAMGAAGNLAAQGNRNATTRIANDANAAIAGSSQLNSQYLADSNKGLADWAARGDYAQQINALNAKLQDARLTQPSVSGQAGGDAFNLIHGGMILSLRFKMISYNAMCIIGDYWLRYGYAVNRFIAIDRLSVMTKFTYWKLSETYLINTRLPEFLKQVIRGIFEKGVTVWTDPDDMGVIDIGDNDPRSGIVIPVDDLPVIVPDEPKPLIPNLDEEDKMYLISTVGTNRTYYWVFGKEYLNLTSSSNAGTAVPKDLVGEDFKSYSPSQFVAACNMLGIPAKYSDVDTFLTENPNGTWSKESDNAAAIISAQTSIGANATLLTQILEMVSNPDAPDDGTASA